MLPEDYGVKSHPNDHTFIFSSYKIFLVKQFLGIGPLKMSYEGSTTNKCSDSSRTLLGCNAV